MIPEMIFKTNALFEKVSYDIDSGASGTWAFNFSNKIHFGTSGFWRVLKNKKLLRISLDHHHQFGLPKPINLIEELTNELNGKKLLEIKVNDETGDVLLSLTDDIQIEIFISSSGYETYEFVIDTKRYIGLGGGEIAFMDY